MGRIEKKKKLEEEQKAKDTATLAALTLAAAAVAAASQTEASSDPGPTPIASGPEPDVLTTLPPIKKASRAYTQKSTLLIEKAIKDIDALDEFGGDYEKDLENIVTTLYKEEIEAAVEEASSSRKKESVRRNRIVRYQKELLRKRNTYKKSAGVVQGVGRKRGIPAAVKDAVKHQVELRATSNDAVTIKRSNYKPLKQLLQEEYAKHFAKVRDCREDEVDIVPDSTLRAVAAEITDHFLRVSVQGKDVTRTFDEGDFRNLMTIMGASKFCHKLNIPKGNDFTYLPTYIYYEHPNLNVLLTQTHPTSLAL